MGKLTHYPPRFPAKNFSINFKPDNFIFVFLFPPQIDENLPHIYDDCNYLVVVLVMLSFVCKEEIF